jgi:hypothetical protein
MAANKLRAESEQLALLISKGATLATIQVQRATVSSATTDNANKQAAANAASTTLTNAANAELSAQQVSATASAQRFALLATIANAQVNADNNAVVAAQTAATNASAAYTAAQTVATNATTALNTAVAGGQTMTQVQTLTAASLAANNALATAKAQNDAAQAALSAAQVTYNRDVVLAADAAEAVIRDSVKSAQAAGLIKTSMTLAENYQTNVAFLATVNQQAQQLNDAQIALNTALVNKQAAINTYTVAKDALDAATKAGGTIPTLVALQQRASAAADAETQAVGVWNAATTTYNGVLSLIQASSQKATLLYSSAQQQVNADTTTAANAQAAANAAATALTSAVSIAAAATAALNTAVTSNASASAISSATTTSQNANAAVVNATLANKSAQTALAAAQATLATNTALFNRGAFGIVDASGLPLLDASGNYILQQAAIMQLARIADATANTLVTSYLSLQAAANTASARAVASANAQDVAEKALQAAITAGLPLDQLTALSVIAGEAQAKTATDANASNAAAAAALNSLGAMYTSPSAANALTILNATLASQNATAIQAHNNQLSAQLNKAYANNVNATNMVVTDQYALYLSQSALTNAVEGGASITQIRKLQDAVQQVANKLANDKLKSDQAAASLSQQQSWANLDPNSATILQASQAAANAAARAASINTLVLNYMNRLSEKNEATSAQRAAQSQYNTDNAALNTAITQGASVQAIQGLQATVQAAAAVLGNAQAATNLATASAASAYNTLLGRDASGNILRDSSGNPLVDGSGNSVNQAALTILANALIVQNQAIDNANANTTVQAYQNAFSVYQTTLTAFQAAESATLVAKRNLNIAITSGASVEQIEYLRGVEQDAEVVQAAAQTNMTNALNASNAAYATILSGVTLDNSGNVVSDASGNVLKTRAAVNLLIQTQLAQQRAIANSQSNALARAYMAALDAQTVANITLTSSQASYDSAAAAMNQGITGGATISEIQTLQAAAQTAGQITAQAQTRANAAASAVALALQQVNADPNATAILAQLQRYQANKISLANANNLLNLFYAAKAKKVKAEDDLGLAQNAARIAANALNVAITAGADISQIQTLQVTANQTSIDQSRAQAAYDFAVEQEKQAQSNANSNPIANGIDVSAAQFKAIAAAKANLNAANIALAASVAAKALAAGQATLTASASTAANALLNSAIQPYNATTNPTGGKTQQEIVQLQAAATSAANAAAAAMNASEAASVDVLNKQNSVTAASASLARLPTPSTVVTMAYTMTAVGLNEMTVSANGLELYIDSSVLALAKTGTTIGTNSYPAVQLGPSTDASGNATLGVQILGAGVSELTRIASYSVVPSLPGGLYTTAVKLVLDTPITAGDGVFYLVGGEVLLYNFIM